MSAKDISRFLFQPNKRYSSLRMQQGRVILDSDWNESERIDDEELRRTLLDVICSKGTSNKGFRIRNIRNAEVKVPGSSPVASYDFDFENGSFYIGGLRFETETQGNPETFLGQLDWLQIDEAAENLPVRPENLPAGGVRNDLVYLRGWEQCVTTVEDSELRERALGGPDTSVRIRRMRRVEVLPDVPDTCPAAVKALKEKLTAPIPPDTGQPHKFDTRNYELISKARLTVSPNPADITEDPCKPAVPGGYLGADNQTIRVQLTATNRFIWGYDNASPFYRVQVENIPDVPQGVDGTRRQVRFLTLPRDQAAQPLAGQAVEIIPWGALLPNQEKIAEFQGQIVTVETSFDPEESSLTITQPVPLEQVQWLADHPQFESVRDAPEHRQYFYLRLWTGGSGDANKPDFQFTPGTPVALEGTGLSVTLSDDGLPGDFWIIAARPSTPDLVVPWELLDSAAPAGPRYFFAPLAIIRWSRNQNELQTTVHDCRERFRSLCNLRGCCTVTVGDNLSSHGDFDSIEDAVAFLPDEGGEVCLLPGLHRAEVTIINRRNITIKGCGKQTQVIPRTSNSAGTIFHVLDSQGITLREMEVISLAGTAIIVEASKPGALKEINIAHNRILAGKSAIQARLGVDVHIHNNLIRMLDVEGSLVAIQILAEDSVIDHNDIGVVPADQTPPPDLPDDTPDPTNPCVDLELFQVVPILRLFADHILGVLIAAFPAALFKALGGIQIAAGSERIKVLDNVIAGGTGNGIMLGGGLPGSVATPQEGTDQTQHLIQSAGNAIKGDVEQGGSGVPGIGLVFTRADGVVRTVVTGSGGFFTVPTEAGQYAVSLSTPGLEIETITAFDDFDGGLAHRITVVKQQAPPPEDDLGFLFEIQIDRNEISRMGLSGIGFPIVALLRPTTTPPVTTVGVKTPVAKALLAVFGNPVVTLGIHRNHIHDCLQNPFDAVLRAEALHRGFGGISLGSCEDVTITGNRIEGNGTTHINPVCGIFVRSGDSVDVQGNHVFHNGPLDATTKQNLEGGFRGGIVLFVDGLLPRLAGDLETGRHAARVSDNIVHQPAGRALWVEAVGPTSISHNQLVTEIAGADGLDFFGGAGVRVVTYGGVGKFPPGPTLFNNNQTRLGPNAICFLGQLIRATDDLGFGNNQSVSLTDGATVQGFSFFQNTVLIGRTLRATDNRFQEPLLRGRLAAKLSLITLSTVLNNTNNNQGDHCIIALNVDPGPPPIPGPPPNVAGNQVVDNTNCAGFINRLAAQTSRFQFGAPIRGD